MKTGLRWVLRGFTALSLALCLAAAALWVRSYFVADVLSFLRIGGIERPGDHGDLSHEYTCRSSRGRLRLEFWENEDRNYTTEDGPSAPPQPSTRWVYSTSPAGQLQDVERSQWTSVRESRLGFVMGEEQYLGNHAESMLKYVVIPDWPVTMLLAGLPSVSLLTWMRRRRLNRAGLCRRCGYDLRASPMRCPECGLLVTTAAVSGDVVPAGPRAPVR